MKIITEKIQGKPDHSITKQDIKVVLEIIPDDWVGVANIFQISSQLFENSDWDRPVIENNTTFRILSRGFEKEEIIKELLIELAINPTRTYPKFGHKLTKVQRKKLEDLISPYCKEVMERINKA